MGFLEAAVGNFVGIVAFCLVAGGVLKLFQIATTLGEIKDQLSSLQRRSDFASAGNEPPAASAASGEEMLRALDREMHLEDSVQAIDPEIVEPR